MAILVQCVCGKRGWVREGHAEKWMTCPRCGVSISVPLAIPNDLVDRPGPMSRCTPSFVPVEPPEQSSAALGSGEERPPFGENPRAFVRVLGGGCVAFRGVANDGAT